MALDWGDGPAPDLWTVPDESQPNGRAMSPIILEDKQFGEAIQQSMQSTAFTSLPLSYQEARIYSFHQSCDRMIGIGNVPRHLRIEQVIGAEWVWPNYPRADQMQDDLLHNGQRNGG
jgi:hypothetical protein